MKSRGLVQFPAISTKSRGRVQFPAISMKISRNRVQKELIRMGKRKCRLSLKNNSAPVDEASMEDPSVKDFSGTEFSMEDTSLDGFSTKDLFYEETALGEAIDKSTSNNQSNKKHSTAKDYTLPDSAMDYTLPDSAMNYTLPDSVLNHSATTNSKKQDNSQKHNHQYMDLDTIEKYDMKHSFDKHSRKKHNLEKVFTKKQRRRTTFISSYTDLTKEIQLATRVPLKVTLSRTIPLMDAEIILKRMTKEKKMKKEIFDVVNKKFLYYTVRQLNRARRKLVHLKRQLKYLNKYGGREAGKNINVLKSEVARLHLLTGKEEDKPNAEKDSSKLTVKEDKPNAEKDSSKKQNNALKHSFKKEATVFVSSYSDLEREIKLAMGGPLNVTLRRTLPLVDAEIIRRGMKNGNLYRVINVKFLWYLIHKLRRAREKLKFLKFELYFLLKFGGRNSQERIDVLRGKVNKLQLLTKRKK